jgi:hypothetical protein
VRKSEAFRHDWGHVDLDAGVLVISRLVGGLLSVIAFPDSRL